MAFKSVLQGIQTMAVQNLTFSKEPSSEPWLSSAASGGSSSVERQLLQGAACKEAEASSKHLLCIIHKTH